MVILSLYDLTGIMVEPWRDAGYECICVDIQHPKDGKEVNGVSFINLDLSHNSDAWETLYEMLNGQEVFIMGFPPCTHLAASGAMHWKRKAFDDIDFQENAAECARRIEKLAIKLKAKFMVENPRGALTRLWRKPNYEFDPCDYGGYLPSSDAHPLYPEYIPPQDAYEKRTCIWSGGGFIMPPRRRVEPQYFLYRKGDGSLMKVSKPAAKLGGDTLKTKNIRSATPRGFALAVYYANRRTDWQE